MGDPPPKSAFARRVRAARPGGRALTSATMSSPACSCASSPSGARRFAFDRRTRGRRRSASLGSADPKTVPEERREVGRYTAGFADTATGDGGPVTAGHPMADFAVQVLDRQVRHGQPRTRETQGRIVRTYILPAAARRTVDATDAGPVRDRFATMASTARRRPPYDAGAADDDAQGRTPGIPRPSRLSARLWYRPDRPGPVLPGSKSEDSMPVPARRPLSPHLSIYRPEITSVLSILHRLSGLVLGLGMVALAVFLWATAAGPAAFRVGAAAFSSLFGSAFLVAVSAAFFYHLANGVRHLFWDAGLGFEMGAVRASGWFVVGLAVLLTALFWSGVAAA